MFLAIGCSSVAKGGGGCTGGLTGTEGGGMGWAPLMCGGNSAVGVGGAIVGGGVNSGCFFKL